MQPRLHVIVLVTLMAIAAYAHASAKGTKSPATATGATSGQRTFAARCSGCHGLDGRGSERAPNLATDQAMRHLSDSDLKQIVSNGRPNSGMPAFHELGSEQIGHVVDYLRFLQGVGAVSPAGNAKKGADLFFGRAACSTCHSDSGQAGFAGSDLTLYGRGLTPTQIRKSITDPPPGAVRARMAVATREGRTFSGAVRNEDNFSIQLQSADGTFHFLLKADLDKLEYQPLPGMPTDYGQKLSAQELDDLVGYLQSIQTGPDPAAHPEE